MSRQERLLALGQLVAAQQDGASPADGFGQARRGFLAHVDDAYGRQARRRSVMSVWRPRVLSAAAAFSLLALGASAFHVLRAERPLAFAIEGREGQAQVGDWLAAPVDDTLALQFSDGSRFELAPSARGRVLEVDAQGSHVMLERGSAAVQVARRSDARWRFSAGPFTVEVLGTEFDLAWDPEQDEFVLRLTAGRVNVSGCNFREGRPVLPGETVRASCAARRFEVVSSATPELDDGEVSDASAEGAEPEEAPRGAEVRGAAPAQRRLVAKEASWRGLAREGRYAEAITLAEAEGFDAALAEASAADLGLLADAARLTGRNDRALSAYQAMRQRFAGTMPSSTAAFHLARIYFDQQGAYARAAAWFETYLTERPQGGLAREATGRWLESLQRAGNQAGARQVAERYLENYPQGPHAPLARNVLGQ